MPIYEFRCPDCGNFSSLIAKVSEDPKVICNRCPGQRLMKKIISQSYFRLKGTGWYETDFKNKGKEPAKTIETQAKEPTNPAVEMTGNSE